MNAIGNKWLLLYQRHNESFEFKSDNKTAEVEIDLQLSMQEKLARAIEKEMNFKISSNERCNRKN
jgi:hypothetical protein